MSYSIEYEKQISSANSKEAARKVEAAVKAASQTSLLLKSMKDKLKSVKR